MPSIPSTHCVREICLSCVLDDAPRIWSSFLPWLATAIELARIPPSRILVHHACPLREDIAELCTRMGLVTRAVEPFDPIKECDLESSVLGSGIGSRGEMLGLKRGLLSRAIPEDGDLSILDCGCGDLEIVKDFPWKAYTGIDVSIEALRIALGLLVSAYDRDPDIASHITYFHEPLGSTLAARDDVDFVLRLGEYRDTAVYFVAKRIPGFVFPGDVMNKERMSDRCAVAREFIRKTRLITG